MTTQRSAWTPTGPRAGERERKAQKTPPAHVHCTTTPRRYPPGQLSPQTGPVTTPDVVLAIVGEEFGWSLDALSGRSRSPGRLTVRHLAINLLYQFTDLSTEAIAATVGVSRVSVPYALYRIGDLLADPFYAGPYLDAVSRIRPLLRSAS